MGILDRQITALIVDDVADIRDVIIQQLAQVSINCVGASDGEEAILVLKKQSIDLVITDLAMPKMNGFELLRRMKMKGFDIPTFVLTGHADKTVAQQLKVFGIRAFINKPWAWEDLAPLVEKVVQEIRAKKAVS